MEVSSKLQPVLDLWGLYSLESLSEKLQAGMIYLFRAHCQCFIFSFSSTQFVICSGGESVSGCLHFLLDYLLLPWGAVQRVHIGYTRFFPLEVLIFT